MPFTNPLWEASHPENLNIDKFTYDQFEDGLDNSGALRDFGGFKDVIIDVGSIESPLDLLVSLEVIRTQCFDLLNEDTTFNSKDMDQLGTIHDQLFEILKVMVQNFGQPMT